MFLRTIFILLILTSLGFSQVNSAKKFLNTLNKPESVTEFTVPFHFPPLNQDTTNACWSFATLSFLETEMQRVGLQPVKLSMMYAVYYSFIEKARYYVKTKGTSRFAGGDLFSGVFETIKKYGIVPYEIYQGDVRTCKTFNHTGLEEELTQFMKHVKTLDVWDEQLVLEKVKEILDMHLGTPPKSFSFQGKNYSPKSFAERVVKLPWDEYVIVTSFQYAAFNQFIEMDVPDNWAHRNIYYNVPLDVFYSYLKNAIQSGYSAAFDSDTGEPGRMGSEDAVFVPDFDIPGKYINQDAREMRFENGSTTDDHLMHILAYKNFSGHDWFLVKDSWRTAWMGSAPGYYYFHGDYIRLKALAYMVHKDAIPGLVK